MTGVVGDSRCLRRELVDSNSLMDAHDTGLNGLAKLRDKNRSGARIEVCWRAIRVEKLGG